LQSQIKKRKLHISDELCAQRDMNTNSIHFGLILIGIVLLGFAAWQFQITRNLLQTGRRAPGTVASLGEYKDSDGDLMYKPIVHYRDEHGELFKFEPVSGSNIHSFSLGEKLDVVYDPHHRWGARIYSFWGLYRQSILSACAGFPMLFVGIGYFLFRSLA
jgi:Protein of unknown function (DUF3592)